MDFNYFDQLDGGYPWWMEARTFVDDEGFNVQPQPHQPQLEEFPTYSTTIHSDEFSYSGVGQEANYLEFEVPIVRQPTASWSENVATYVAAQAQYDEAPAPSSMSAVAHVNNSGASTNHSRSNQPSAITSSSSNKRKLEEHVGCFSIYSDPKENRRKRQAFDQETRKKVAMIRKVGSCSRCKARRVKVSFGPDFVLTSLLIPSSAISQVPALHAGRQQIASASRNTFAFVKHCWSSALVRRVLVDTLSNI
jgi:hypothetical protein